MKYISDGILNKLNFTWMLINIIENNPPIKAPKIPIIPPCNIKTLLRLVISIPCDNKIVIGPFFSIIIMAIAAKRLIKPTIRQQERKN